MKITHIVVLINGTGTDQINLHTDLPAPFPAEVSDQPCTMRIDTTKGWGVNYAIAHFDAPVESLCLKTGTRKKVG
jgi:hypothetical protein